MKKLLVIMLFINVFFQGCAMGDNEVWDHITPLTAESRSVSEGMTTLTYSPAAVSDIDLNHGFQLELVKGNSPRIEITVPEDRADQVLAGFLGDSPDRIVITRKKNASNTAYTEKVRITLPRLNALDLSGRAGWTGFDLQQDSPLTIELSTGSSGLVDGRFDLPGLRLEQSSDASFKLTGRAVKTTVELSQGRKMDLRGLSVDELVLDISRDAVFSGVVGSKSRVEASGNSTVNLEQRSGEVTAELASTAVLNLTGGATLRRIDD